MAASFTQRFKDITPLIEQAAARANADDHASAPLRAVVAELQDKAQQAVAALPGADERAIRDHIIEVEQAADSAKKAALAEADLASDTRQAVIEAHGAICALKKELLELTGT